MKTNKIDESYNGYANYPTWSVMLIVSNTESLYNYFKGVTKKAVESEETESNRIAYISSALEEIVNKLKPQNANPLWDQLMNHAESEIDYWELAETMLNDYEE